ncbi:hypothetical protein [uncultured Ruegeria sp.]|uniref:hypothetical protein n=1 Tax=uncultured Ruegeria sp. TaxID=259304 RepID=UPI00262D3D16|nr:hypothetical protein [uncultured Ruegeria sp.]
MNDTHIHDEIELLLEHHDQASRRLRRLTFLLAVVVATVVAASFTIVVKTVSSAIRTVGSCWAARKSLMPQSLELDG